MGAIRKGGFTLERIPLRDVKKAKDRVATKLAHQAARKHSSALDVGKFRKCFIHSINQVL